MFTFVFRLTNINDKMQATDYKAHLSTNLTEGIKKIIKRVFSIKRSQTCQNYQHL